MQKIYIHILLIIFLALAFISKSEAQEQPFEISERLDWQSPKELVDGEYMLYFEGAVNHDNLGMLPVYQAILAGLQNVSVSDIKLSDETYEPIEPEYLTAPEDLKLIEDEPKIILSVFTSNKITQQVINILPLRISRENGSIEKLVTFKISINSPGKTISPSSRESSRTYAEHSVLRSGDWYKIAVNKTGIHKITYQDLENMGIDPSGVNPRNIRLYGNGSGMLEEANAIERPDDLLENSIFIEGESDGVFNQQDYILFYGEDPTVIKYNPFYLQYEHEINFYTNETYYFLTISNNPGKRIIAGEIAEGEVTNELNTFQDFAYYEKDSLNLIKSGKIWYGEVFNTKVDYTFPFVLKDIDLSQPVYFKGNLAARSTVTTVFNIYTDGDFLEEIDVPSIALGSQQLYARAIISNYEMFYADDENVDIGIEFVKPGTIDAGWLNYIELNYTRHLKFTGGQLSFRDMRFVGPGNIGRYNVETALDGIRIWEVTTPETITNCDVHNEPGGVSIKAALDKQRDFIAFDGTQFFSPVFSGKIENQDLHSLQPADYIIISHPMFLDQASRLADYHRQYDGMTSHIVIPDHIYNEFSSGAQDVSAIRDFMKMLYDRAGDGDEPRYLLLFGDASYDYKKLLQDDQNLVPAYQSRESLKISASFVTDDYFACLDDDEGSTGAGTMDIGVGRFPVTTVEQAEAMVNKTINYMMPKRENFGPWRNVISYIGDDEDNNTHLKQAEGLAEITDSLGTEYNINKIYLDAYVQVKTGSGNRYPDVNEAINDDVSNGCLFMNYTGHGGEIAWAEERILDIPGIQSYRNTNQLPAFVVATCEFSRYDDPSLVSAGELVFLNPDGAGIGLFTTTRLAFSQSNYAYNKRFYYEAYKVDSATGEYPRMGDLIKAAKTPSNTNIKNFILIGDPALMLAYPKMKVRTLNIINEELGRTTDTIHALSKVTIEGQVEDLSGNRLVNYNGLIHTSIFDKPVVYKTRGNDPASKVTDFYIQNKEIFRGKSTVIEGYFSFTFIVPVDISYQYGKGKISYYAVDTINLIDANGYDPVWIGGSDDAAVSDMTGPEIELFLNTLSFVSGDYTTSSPMLMVNLFDESGINTVGNGIGHDIIATIDGDSQQPIVLNDYFIPETDSYQAGTIQYQLGPFENGMHTLTLKAWDVLNNSSEKTIEFQVNTGAKLTVNNLESRPNPYLENTTFYFEHNKPGSKLDVIIYIYSLMGNHVTTLEYTVMNESTDSGPLFWSGRDDSGNELSSGLYVIKLVVRSDDGYYVTLSQKLLHFE